MKDDHKAEGGKEGKDEGSRMKDDHKAEGESKDEG